MLKIVKTVAFVIVLNLFITPSFGQIDYLESIGKIYIDKYGRKNCTKGQPCGNSCISWSYTCHVNDPLPTTPVVTNSLPYASFTVTPSTGNVPLNVNVNASSSYDTDGSISSYSWSSSDGQFKSGITADFLFKIANNYTITLSVTDNKGATATKQVTVSAMEVVKPIVTTPTKPKPDSASCSAVSLLSVVDGDTLYVNSNGVDEKVRISQIDAPEKSQSFGAQAKACLISILSVGNLTICRDGYDKYGRTLANVFANNQDVGQQLVAQGCAWAYTQYLEVGSNLPALENTAKQQHIGLWSGNDPIAPWDYRHGTVPVLVINNTNATAIPVTTETMANTWDRIFDWAEQKYVFDLANGTDTNSLEDGMKYRCYHHAGIFCVGVKMETVYTYDGQVIKDIGNVQYYLDQAKKDGF